MAVIPGPLGQSSRISGLQILVSEIPSQKNKVGNSCVGSSGSRQLLENLPIDSRKSENRMVTVLSTVKSSVGLMGFHKGCLLLRKGELRPQVEGNDTGGSLEGGGPSQVSTMI